MTYSELLHSVKFDDIVPFISKYHGHEDCMAWYKIHYDILCQMIPHRDEDIDEEGNDITNATIKYYIPEEDETDVGIDHLEAFPMEGDPWEVSLAKELVIAPDVTASKEEIAACCLWHTSFYGFTPDDLFKPSNLRETEIGIVAKRVKALCGKWLPTRKQMLQKRSFHNKVRSVMKYDRARPTREEKNNIYMYKDEVIDYSKCRWRTWKRRAIADEYNSELAHIGRFVEWLHEGENIVAPPTIKELCNKLFSAEHCHLISYQTHIGDANSRCEYFKELIVKYDAFNSARLSAAIVCLSSSSVYPVTMEEMELVKLATQGCEEVQFCVKMDDNLAQELMISIAVYES